MNFQILYKIRQNGNLYLTILLLLISIHFWVYTHFFPVKYFSDSYIYLELAKNLSAGKGYYLAENPHQIYSFYPPLYSLFIALVQLLTGLSSYASVRLVSYFSLLLFLYLFDKILRFYDLKPVWRLGILLLFWFSSTYVIYLIALSEQIFLPLFSAHIYALLKWYKYRKNKYLWRAGLFMGFMLLTRYAALGLLFSESLWILWILYRYKISYHRIFAFLLPPSIVFGTWYAVLYLNRSLTMGRKLVIHPPNKFHLKDLIISISNWLSPGFTPYFVLPAFVLLAWIMNKNRKQVVVLLHQDDTWLWLFNFIGYLLFITATVFLFDHTTSYDWRMLLPVYFSFVIMVALLLSKSFKKRMKKYIGLLLALIFASHLVFFAQLNILVEEKNYMKGLETYLQTSYLYIYTNTPDVFPEYMQKDNHLQSLPFKYDPKSTLRNPDYNKQLELMKKRVLQHKAVIIYFDKHDDRIFLTSPDELNQIFPDIKQKTFSKGIIFENLKE